jgi:hypothetical protein
MIVLDIPRVDWGLFQTPTATGVVAYCGFDIKFREESNCATTQNYQFGVKFLNDGSYTLRLALDFRTGIDERGQYVETGRGG